MLIMIIAFRLKILIMYEENEEFVIVTCLQFLDLNYPQYPYIDLCVC